MRNSSSYNINSSYFFKSTSIIIFLLYIFKNNSFNLCLNRIERPTSPMPKKILEEKAIRNENNVFLVQHGGLKLLNHYEIKNKNIISILL